MSFILNVTFRTLQLLLTYLIRVKRRILIWYAYFFIYFLCDIVYCTNYGDNLLQI
jgi:hypothetical protein